MNPEKVGKFIAHLRKEKNMTQGELAIKLYVDRSLVSKWERGINLPKIEVMQKLSNFFGVSVNELYYGEKINKKNKNEIDKVLINIIKDDKRKIKKILIVSIIFMILFVLFFFGYYFMNTYKSISIYMINGESDNFKLENGVIVLSREKSYIQLGNINNLNNKEIDNIRLYYFKENKEYEIFSGSSSTELFVNNFEHYESYSYRDIKYVLKNLYLEVSYEDDEKEVIKLTSKRDFTNNKLFFKNNNSVSNDEIYEYSINAPKYIKEKFKLDEKHESYYLEEKKEDLVVKQTYYYDVELYIVEEKKDNYNQHFEYFYPDISYFSDDDSIETYSLTEKKCLTKNCDMKLINYFIDNYIDKIRFEN